MENRLINIKTFCLLQGVSELTEIAAIKMYKNSEDKLYKEWYDSLKDNFVLGKEKFIKEK